MAHCGSTARFIWKKHQMLIGMVKSSLNLGNIPKQIIKWYLIKKQTSFYIISVTLAHQ